MRRLLFFQYIVLREKVSFLLSIFDEGVCMRKKIIGALLLAGVIGSTAIADSAFGGALGGSFLGTMVGGIAANSSRSGSGSCSNDRITDLEKRVNDLERRVNQLEKSE